MKTYIGLFLTVLGLSLSLLSCQKNDIEIASPQIQSVSNLQYSLTGDSVTYTWVNPAGADTLTPNITVGGINTSLPVGTTSYKFGIVQTNQEYAFTIKLKASGGNSSLGQTARFIRQGAFPVKNPVGTQNDAGVLLTWTAPDSAVTKINITFGTQTALVDGSTTSYQFTNVPLGDYQVSFVTTNSSNQTSNTVYLPFKVGATVVAYLSDYSDSATMLSSADDDEVAGAKWLFKTYPTARFLSFNDVKNGSVDMTQFRVIWWNFDVTTSHVLPAIATDAAVVAKMTAYYKAGGNLLLNQYAMQYLWTLGRITNNYFTQFDEGNGFSNGDTWGVGVNIDRKHDQSGHPLYSGITMTPQSDGRLTFPVLGPGWRENHNAVIVRIPEFYGGLPNDNETAYTNFTTDNNAEWLGVWDGIGDYFMTGIAEFKPRNDFIGSAIFFGIGGIEWNQNSGTNLYQSTIEKLYKNAIDYLKTK